MLKAQAEKILTIESWARMENEVFFSFLLFVSFCLFAHC